MDEDVISRIWKEKYRDEIQEGKIMTKEEKFNLILQLHSVGLKLMDVMGKERKLKFYDEVCRLKKEELKKFITWQLGKD